MHLIIYLGSQASESYLASNFPEWGSRQSREDNDDNFKFEVAIKSCDLFDENWNSSRSLEA